MAMDWTIAQINQLYDYVVAGKTGGEMAALMGRSRSAIMGKCFHLGLRVGKTDQPKPRKVLAFVPKGQIVVSEGKERIFVPKYPVKYSPSVPQDVNPVNSLLAAGPYNCRFIIGTPSEGLICGLPIGRGSYCDDHHRQCHINHN